MLQLLRKSFRGAVSSGNLRRDDSRKEAPGKTVGVYEFISASRICEKALADCSYAPRDSWTPPPYNRTGCNVI